MIYYVINVFGGSYEEYFSINIGVSTSLEKTESFIKEQECKLAAYKKFESQVQEFENEYHNINRKRQLKERLKWYQDYTSAKDNFLSSLNPIFLTADYQIFKNVDGIEYTEVEGIE